MNSELKNISAQLFRQSHGCSSSQAAARVSSGEGDTHPLSLGKAFLSQWDFSILCWVFCQWRIEQSCVGLSSLRQEIKTGDELVMEVTPALPPALSRAHPVLPSLPAEKACHAGVGKTHCLLAPLGRLWAWGDSAVPEWEVMVGLEVPCGTFTTSAQVAHTDCQRSTR